MSELFILDDSNYCVDITQESGSCDDKSSAPLNLETAKQSLKRLLQWAVATCTQ